MSSVYNVVTLNSVFQSPYFSTTYLIRLVSGRVIEMGADAPSSSESRTESPESSSSSAYILPEATGAWWGTVDPVAAAAFCPEV